MRAIYVNAKDVEWDDLRFELAELRADSGPEAEIFFDEEERGRRFQAMIARIKSGAVKEVIVHNPMRLGEDSEIKQAVRQIENAGGSVTFLASEPRPRPEPE